MLNQVRSVMIIGIGNQYNYIVCPLVSFGLWIGEGIGHGLDLLSVVGLKRKRCCDSRFYFFARSGLNSRAGNKLRGVHFFKSDS